jgi:hypothetical protein
MAADKFVRILRSQMNFTRPSQRENLLFVIVLLLPPVFAGARYIESVRQPAHMSQARPGWRDRLALKRAAGHSKDHWSDRLAHLLSP